MAFSFNGIQQNDAHQMGIWQNDNQQNGIYSGQIGKSIMSLPCWVSFCRKSWRLVQFQSFFCLNVSKQKTIWSSNGRHDTQHNDI